MQNALSSVAFLALDVEWLETLGSKFLCPEGTLQVSHGEQHGRVGGGTGEEGPEVGPGAFCAARRNKIPVILEAMVIVKALLMSQKS